jgi:hypothetical protein
LGASSFRGVAGSVEVEFAQGAARPCHRDQELNAMKAPSEYFSDPRHLGGPCAAVFVALGGAAIVVGGMLLVGVRELSVARFIPDFATLHSLIVG